MIDPRPPRPRRVDGAADPELASILAFARDRSTAHRERLVASGVLPAVVPQRSSAASRVASLIDAANVTAKAPAAAATGGPPGVLLSREDVSPSVGVFRIGRPAGFQFVAGQAVKIGVGAVTRSYTIASAPAAPYLELCVERVPGGALTSQLFSLAPGARLVIEPKPKGSLVLDTSAAAHLMVATVTGIAPFISMLRDVLPRAPHTRVILIHGARAEEDLAYRTELEDLAARHAGFDFLPAVTQPSVSWTGLRGRVTEHVDRALAGLAAPRASAARGARALATYACGHPDMVADVTARMNTLGLPIRTEEFWT